MSYIALTVENLGKLYRLQPTQERYKTLRDTIVEISRRPFDAVRSRLSHTPRTPQESAFWSLRHLSFDVNRGDVVGIIGRNGAGKSTLLKVLSRITPPTEGRATLSGRVGSLLEVGTGFHPELSGRDNVYLNGAILGMKRADIDRQFDNIVTFAEIDRFIDTPVKHYSTGMYLRLAFAVAAHLEPDILIVDEVLAVGDTAFQKKCLQKMNDVSGHGRTVLFVSHNMSAVLALCNKALLISDGQLSYYGPVTDGVQHYMQELAAPLVTHVDLTSHPGRSPRMIPVLTAISISTTATGGPTAGAIFCTGAPLTIDLHFDATHTYCDFALIGICSMLGERICTVSTLHSPDFHTVLSGSGILRCTLPELPLTEGDYSLMISIGQKTAGRNVDHIEGAIQFHVSVNDYFGSSDSPLPGQGYLAMRCRWHVTDSHPVIQAP